MKLGRHFFRLFLIVLSLFGCGLEMTHGQPLYGIIDGNSNIYEVGVNDGIVTDLGATAAGGEPGALAFNNQDGLLYYVQVAAPTFDRNLYSFNPSNGANTLIGDTGHNKDIFGLAFDQDNNLYGMDANENLLRINPTTGAIIESTTLPLQGTGSEYTGDLVSSPGGDLLVLTSEKIYKISKADLDDGAPYSLTEILTKGQSEILGATLLTEPVTGAFTIFEVANGDTKLYYFLYEGKELKEQKDHNTTFPNSNPAYLSDLASAPIFGGKIQGYVYEDENVNSTKDVGEGSPQFYPSSLYFKYIESGNASANESYEVPIDTDGSFELDMGLPAGTYDVIIDDTKDVGDITPLSPTSGYFISETTDFKETITLSAGSWGVAVEQNFGLYRTGNISVAPTSGLTVTEAGGTATFDVVLLQAPTADVIIALSSDDTSEGTISPTSLTFQTGNWNSAQTVTITGVNDGAPDGAVLFNIVTDPASSLDNVYNGLDASDVSVTNQDDDGGNAAPTASGGTVTTNEDTEVVVTFTDLGYADGDTDVMSHIEIELPLPAAGTLYVDDTPQDGNYDAGEEVADGENISKATIDASLLKFIPVANENGTGYDTLNFFVNDGTENSASAATITFDVTAVNDPPAFTASGDVTVAEDFGTQQTVTVTPGPIPSDESGQTVTYALSPATVSFAMIGFNTSTGEVTIDAVSNGNGSQLFTITADDGQGANNLATDTFTLTVNAENDPPTFTTSGDVTVAEDFVTQQTVTVTPGPVPTDEAGQTVTYALSPATVSFATIGFNTSTGQVTIDAVSNGNGSQLFTITADDGQGASNTATDTFTLMVNAENDPPAFTTSGDVTVAEDFGTQQTVTVTPGPVPTDESGQSVIYALSPATVSFATIGFNTSTGEVTIDAVSNGNGSQLFTITADDGQGANNLATDTFTLTVNAENDDPTISAIAGQSTDEDVTKTGIAFTVDEGGGPDEDAQVLTVTATSSNTTLVPNGNIVVNYTDNGSGSANALSPTLDITPVADLSGSTTITVTVQDGSGSGMLTFGLTVTAVNDDPTITAIGNQFTTQDISKSGIAFTVDEGGASDEDAQVLTVMATSSNQTIVPDGNIAVNYTDNGGASADVLNPTIDITPASGQVGTVTITVTVQDNGSGTPSALETFDLSVDPISDHGPGGVSEQLKYWFKADGGVNTTGSLIDSWDDQSANGASATSTGTNRASLTTANASINNQPSITFDGNDYLTFAHSAADNENRSYGAMLSTSTPTNDRDAIIYESERITLGYRGSGEASPSVFYDRIGGTNGIPTTQFANGNWLIHQKTVETAGTKSFYFNGSAIPETDTHSPQGESSSTTYLGETDGLNRGFNGELGEVYKFGKVLNHAEKTVIDNYLSAKYDIAITASDYYAGDDLANGDYDFDLIGIGTSINEAVPGSHTTSNGFDGLSMTAVSGFEDDDYVFAGHDNVANVLNTSDLGGLSNIHGRWERVWYIDKTDASTALAVDLTFDFSNAGLTTAPTTASNYKLIYRSGQTGNWSVAATGSSTTSDQLTFSNVALSDGDGYYTIGQTQSFILSTTTGNTDETGMTAQFTVVLGEQPVSNVVLSVTSGDTNEGTVDKSSLSFNNANWNVAQTVTVSGVDDELIDGDISYDITVSVVDGSSDDTFDSLPDQTVSITNSDDDVFENSENLIINPSAEVDPTTYGWTWVSGGWVSGTEIAPQHGNFHFYAGSGAGTFEIYQDIDVSYLANPIDAGTVDFSFSGYMGNYQGLDEAKIIVEYRDASSNVLSSYNTGFQTIQAWTLYCDKSTALANTRTIRVRLQSRRNAGVDNDGYIDNLVLQAITQNPGFDICPSVVYAEEGGTTNFDFALSSAPASNVTIDIASLDPGAATSNVSSISFDNSNWDTPQTVIITGEQDADSDNENVEFTLIVNDAVSDNSFDGLSQKILAVIDDDEVGYTVSDIAGNIQESGTTASFTVVLNNQPATDVVFDVSSSDIAEGTVDQASLTFTTTNWSVPQTVVVTGVDESLVDGDQTFNILASVNDAASDDLFDPLADQTVIVINEDDDVAGFTIVESGGSTYTTEDGTMDSFTVVLDAQPTDPVIINIPTPDATEISLDATSLTFTNANWNIAQTVNVTGLDDAIDDNGTTILITFSVDPSSDAGFLSVPDGSITAVNEDNDPPGITVTPTSGLIIDESGTTATFNVNLQSEPTADVTLNLSSSDPGEGTVSPTSFVFNASNWNGTNTFTITGVDDNLIDGDVNFTIITAPLISADTHSGINPEDVSVTNEDNDVASFTVSSISGNTHESGTTADFTVVLDAQPLSDVVFKVTSTDTGEGTVNKSVLTFTDSDWNNPQTVTVTGKDEPLLDGDITYNITVSVNDAASDDAFDILADKTVSVTNEDNEVAGFSTSVVSGITNESGTTDTLAVVLDVQPLTNVVFSVISNDTGEGTLDLSTLTFTNSNWGVSQEVIITGVDDSLIDGDISFGINVSIDDASSDDGFDALADQMVAITNEDDDVAGFTLSTTSITLSEDGSNTFTIVLDAEPAADVLIDVSTTATEISLDVPQITLNAANWDTGEMVTITAGETGSQSDLSRTILAEVNASSDPNFTAVADQNLNVTVNPVNDKPLITAQVALSTDEDTDLTITLTDLTVTDPDNNYPADFTLTVGTGTNYTVTGTTITPATDFNGTLTVPVTVNDGTIDSDPFNLSVTVDAVNDPPSITLPEDQTVNEDDEITDIAFFVDEGGGTDEDVQTLTVSVTSNDQSIIPDANISQDYGDNGTASASLESPVIDITPLPEAFGVVTITITVQDNGSGTNIAVGTFDLNVRPVNDQPTFTPGPDVIVDEDFGSYTAQWATDLNKGQTNESAQTLTFMVTNDDNSLFEVQPYMNSDGVLFFTTKDHAFGQANVDVFMYDDGGVLYQGVNTSDTEGFKITINEINDTPTGVDQGINVAASSTYIFAESDFNDQYADVEGDPFDGIRIVERSGVTDGTLTYNSAAIPGDNFDISANNITKLQYDSDITTGTFSFTFKVQDDNGAFSDDTYTMYLVVGTPNLPTGAAITRVIDEDEAYDFTSAEFQAVYSHPGALPFDGIKITILETTGTLKLNGTDVTLNQVIKKTNLSNLTFTPADNENGGSYDSFGFTVRDASNSESASSYTYTFDVTPLNDAPVFEIEGDQFAYDEDGAQTVTGFMTGQDDGDPELTQNLSIQVTNSKNELFDVQPAIDVTTGDLTYTPADKANGLAIVTVTLSDDGGTPNGGVDGSVRTFKLTIMDGISTTPTTIPAGSYIVDMGNPTGLEDGLLPYGLVFDLTSNYEVPVSIAINENKAKDGIDFSHEGVDYKGAPFIISEEFITPEIAAVITSWEDNGSKVGGAGEPGIEGNYTTTDALNVPIYVTFTSYPTWTLDTENAGIAIGYFNLAGIPSSAYKTAYPYELDNTDDIFVMPHADPSWDDHSNLYYWNQSVDNGGQGGWIWAGCHAVSVLENLSNPLDSTEKMNFLSDPALLHYQTDGHDSGSDPYSYRYPGHQFMQFVGTYDGATNNGSEQIYLPKLNGGWRASTQVAVYDPDHSDIPANSPGEAAKMVFGPAFGDPENGMVLYQGGHTLDAGTDLEKAAAIRAFLNFSFLAPVSKVPVTTTFFVPDEMGQGTAYSLLIDAEGRDGLTPSYEWSASCGGSFDDNTSSSPMYTPPAVGSPTACLISVKITDSFGRQSFETHNVNILATTAPTFSTFTTPVKTGNEDVELEITFAELLAASDATDVDGTVQDFIVQTLLNGTLNIGTDAGSATPFVAGSNDLVDATNNLYWTPPADEFGTVDFIEATVQDDLGANSTDLVTGQITVNTVNDVPSFIKGNNQTILEDAGAQTVNTWATSISAGPANESSQMVSFNVSNDNNALFSSQPAVDASGNLTYTPVADANGSATVTISISDNGGIANGGVDTSADQTFTITLDAVNDKPVITAQSALITDEETDLTITLTDLTVTDPDNTYPADFTLTVSTGTNYTVTGNTITPATDFNGTLTVPVTVNDGTIDSDPFNLSVTVDAVNDKPVITAQSALSTDEETDLTINLTDLTVTDPDNTYPADFTLTVSTGTNYTVTGNTITPATDFNGTLTVPVTVNDGTIDSDPFNLSVTVDAVNDKPVITAQVALSTDEETDLTITLTDLTVTDPDNTYPADFTLTVSTGTNYTVTGNTITPATDFNGTLTVPVTVNDGTIDSDPFNLSITVDAVNDKPVITAQSALSTDEETDLTITLTDLTVTDPDNTYPADFTLTVSTGTNYTVTGTTITPATDFNGTLTVPVTVNDGTIDSDPFNLSITVDAVNDKPVITAQSALSTDEETDLTITLTDLTVTDPDNTYPADFTLTVSTGTNYTVTGNTITPATDFNGTLTVPVTVNDGTIDSDPFNLSVTVDAVNDKPVITAQSALITDEETDLTITLTDLTVTDPDNTYPADFTLTVSTGTNYTVTGNTITPATDFNGTLTVPVTVNDGTIDSDPFNLSVTVDAVNDKPVITAQSALITDEETDLTITLTDLTVTDPDNTYPADFTLTVSTGTNYTVTGTTITPATDFNGTLTVPVTVNDGTIDSDPFNLSVTVDAVNDKPVITAQVALSTDEETDLTINLTDLTVSDPDNTYPADFTLTVSTGTNYTVSGNTITPATDFNGTLTVPVTVNDGTIDSDPFNLSVTVDAVNDKPVITAQSALITDEETDLTITLTDLTVTDPDNTYPADFTLTVSTGTNYTVTGTTITPATDFNGTLTVPVTVNDGTIDSDPFNLSVTVDAVNDKPVITAQSALSTDEETDLTINLTDLTVTDPDNTYPADFTLTVSTGTNYTVTGNTITPATDFNGTLTVPVTVNDGTIDSDPFNLSITVDAVNDKPVITAQSALSTDEETDLTINLTDLTVTDPDNTYPADFTLTVSTGTNYTVTGNTITPATDFNGTLTVPVTVNDGTIDSDPFNLSITVDAVNDKPVITAQSALSTDEETDLTITLTDLTVTDPDNTYPADFTLTVSTGTNYTVTGTTITPATDFNGTLTVPVTVNDGTIDSDPFNLSITVDAVNDKPVITAQSALSTDEETDLTITLTDLTVTDPDNTYPADFTLTVSTGTNYTVTGNTITPATDFNGTLTVPVTVNDGTIDSDPFNLSVTVDAVNDKPVITAQSALITDEETDLTITLTDLTVTDPDNTYPADFTLTVSTGTNYTVTGTTITPATDFNGTLTVPVTVNDGTVDSDPFNLSVTVNPINDKPVITAQSALSTDEETDLTINLTDLTVTDPDNTYPADFTLTVSTGTNYTVTGNTITPATDFNGTLTVPVTVNDGTIDSDPFNLSVTVDAVNDKPVITAQVALSTDEETDLTINLLTDLTVSDPDNTYPADFTLTVSTGTNYTVSGNTITPATDFNGTLTVPVTVNDGTIDSDPFNLSVTVDAVNDKPVITAQSALITDEETDLTITLTDLTVTDPDNTYPADFTLTVSTGTNYTVTGTTITPATDFNGTLTVPVTVNDGTIDSDPFNLSVTVDAVNDKPVITAQSALSTDEETDLTINLTDLTVTDPDNTYPADFTLTVSTGTNYTVTGTTITPATDFNGTLTVPVTVNDGTVDSDPFNLSVTVNPINDKPVITAQSALSTDEETDLTINLTDLTVTDPDNTYPADFTLTVSTGTNYTVTGNTITPATDFNGTLTVPVTVNDGTIDSDPFNLSVTVDAVNDKPVITAQVALSTDEETDLTINLLTDLTVSDPDNTYPADFTLTVSTGTNYTVSGNTITPATDFNGTLTVPVTVNDGTVDSDPFNLSVTVDAVNDKPTFTKGNDITIDEDAGAQSVSGWATSISKGASNENSQTLTFVISLDNTSLFDVEPTVGPSGNLSFTPADNAFGESNVTIFLKDDGGTSNGGMDQSDSEFFKISINGVNDKPQIVDHANRTVTAGVAFEIQLSDLVVSDPDNVYPDDFTLHIESSDKYTLSGNAVTIIQPYNGPLDIMISVNDGELASDLYAYSVNVEDGANLPPEITGQQALSMFEDGTYEMQLSDLIYEDEDNADTDLTLHLESGQNYTFMGQTVTPTADFNGALSVPVKLFDGTDFSEPFAVSITVSPVNDAPIANPDIYEVQLGKTLSVNVLENDSDIDSENLFTNVTTKSTPQFELEIAGNGVLTFVSIDQIGTLTEFYTVCDGGSPEECVEGMITIDVISGDFDEDGLSDEYELAFGDSDADGILDYQDTDSDNDEIPDEIEVGPDSSSPVDSDGDGIPDYLDDDSDADGKSDLQEGNEDCDNDGIPNYLDIRDRCNEIVADGGFSPNGDGVNDHWILDGIEAFPENNVIIFNRWGSIVLEIKNYDNVNNVWFGENENDKGVPDGTYFYVVTIRNTGGDQEVPKKINGFITISR